MFHKPHKQFIDIHKRELLNYSQKLFYDAIILLSNNYVCIETHQQGVWFGQQTLCSALSISPSRQPGR